MNKDAMYEDFLEYYRQWLFSALGIPESLMKQEEVMWILWTVHGSGTDFGAEPAASGVLELVPGFILDLPSYGFVARRIFATEEEGVAERARMKEVGWDSWVKEWADLYDRSRK